MNQEQTLQLKLEKIRDAGYVPGALLEVILDPCISSISSSGEQAVRCGETILCTSVRGKHDMVALVTRDSYGVAREHVWSDLRDVSSALRVLDSDVVR